MNTLAVYNDQSNEQIFQLIEQVISKGIIVDNYNCKQKNKCLHVIKLSPFRLWKRGATICVQSTLIQFNL